LSSSIRMDGLEQIFHHCETFGQFGLFQRYLETLQKYYSKRESLKIHESLSSHIVQPLPEHKLDIEDERMLYARRNSATKKALEAEISLLQTKLDELTLLLKASFSKTYC